MGNDLNNINTVLLISYANIYVDRKTVKARGDNYFKKHQVQITPL